MSVTTRGIIIEPNKYHSPVTFDICKDCLKSKGFIVEPQTEKSDKEIAQHNKKTFEAKFIDLLSDLDVQFYE